MRPICYIKSKKNKKKRPKPGKYNTPMPNSKYQRGEKIILPMIQSGGGATHWLCSQVTTQHFG
jgi:hypothetical protein